MYKNKERQAAHARAYYESHKEQIKAWAKKNYESNKKEISAKNKAFRELHKDQLYAKAKTYRDAHKGEMATYMKNRYERDKQKWSDSWIEKKYGINREVFNKILSSQGGVCKICGKADWGPKGPMVDHDHNNDNCIRGILCHFCNSALGLIRDDPKIAEKMISYLQGGRKWPNKN